MQPSNILIIDDERVICDGCRFALLDKGHSVDICMTGKTGLEAILKGAYDLALLDMKLPDVDGMDILRTVKRKRPGV